MKKHSLAWWKKEADKFFSLYVRRSNADSFGNVVCITCKEIHHWKHIQCGHYIPRNHLSTRFDERNCAPQCCGCNVFGRGKHDLFALALIAKYGKDILIELNDQKNKQVKFTVDHYHAMIEKYQDCLAGIELEG